MSGPKTGLLAERVTLRRGGAVLLDRVDALFAPGELTVVVGPNGAGKSSLLRLLAGLERPDDGRVQLNGQDIAAMAPRSRARRIAYLPQTAELHWNLAVDELVMLGRLPHRGGGSGGATGPADDAAVADALARTGTLALRHRATASLSGGERARALLARALASEPDYILADEPLAHLDPAHQAAILADLAAEAARGTGVILVLHDLTLAARAADAALLLDRGRVAASGVEALCDPVVLARVYGVPFARIDRGEGRPWLIPDPAVQPMKN